MARGRLGRVKRRMARKAFSALRRARLPRPVAKAGANRVGQVVKPIRKRKSMRKYGRRPTKRYGRRPMRRRSMRRTRRY